jgi:methylmalonyl-CoA mutase cobalamin-binding subunit
MGDSVRRILAGSIGNCIHVIGVRNFLSLAEKAGMQTTFLGGAIPVERFVEAIRRENPDIVGVSYRLAPDVCSRLLAELRDQLRSNGLLEGRTYLFGGTAETGRIARGAGFFAEVFDGTQTQEDVIAFVRNLAGMPLLVRPSSRPSHPGTLVERIAARKPFPLIRHHIGLPSVEETVAAITRIADAEALDVVSIAPDQVAQEALFRPEEQAESGRGAGGVPIRSREDLERIYDATRRGNLPLCRCYSGTQDVLQWAQLLAETIRNAWCAVPLSWYNQMDKRGPRPFSQSVREAMTLMRWHAERGIPVEVNEPHQWSLRRASDGITVATAYLAAYNAKKAGVHHYVSQYMLGTPAGMSLAMDLAKMCAMIDLVESLHDQTFRSYREIRPGLSSFPAEPAEARSQLVLSTVIGMALEPDILHVVAACEGHHTAGADDILESVRMATWAVARCREGLPGGALLADETIRRRREELRAQAQVVLDAIRTLGDGASDPLADPDVLERAVRTGILDAPDLEGSGVAPGSIATAIRDGRCVPIDRETGAELSEAERVRQALAKAGGL